MAFLAHAGAALAMAASLGLEAAEPKPVRIMSLNQCSDLLLLELVPTARIASVTFLAHEAVDGIHPGLDRGVRINHGAAEDIVADRPDLIVAGEVSTPVARRLAAKSGARILLVPGADDFPQIRELTLKLGRAVGEPARAQALVAKMDETLSALAASHPRPFRAVVYSGGSSPGRRTLADAIVTAAGGVNLAAPKGESRYGDFGVEELMQADPDVLLLGRRAGELPAVKGSALLHPLVRRRFGTRTIRYSEALWSCGVPDSADAALALRAAVDRLGSGRRR